jgi:hypothetical protein
MTTESQLFDSIFESCLYGIAEEEPEYDPLLEVPEWPPDIQTIAESGRLSVESRDGVGCGYVSDYSDSSVPSACSARYIDKKFQDCFQIGLDGNDI